MKRKQLIHNSPPYFEALGLHNVGRCLGLSNVNLFLIYSLDH